MADQNRNKSGIWIFFNPELLSVDIIIEPQTTNNIIWKFSCNYIEDGRK
jgi:hypothetical protein